MAWCVAPRLLAGMMKKAEQIAADVEDTRVLRQLLQAHPADRSGGVALGPDVGDAFGYARAIRLPISECARCLGLFVNCVRECARFPFPFPNAASGRS